MKKTILLIVSSLMTMAMQAQTISEQQAQQTAAEFYQAHGASKSFEARSNKPYKSPTPSTLRKAYEAPQQALYVFNSPEETGFVIVAGKESSTPILGWSDNGPFDYNRAPCGLKAMLEQYVKDLSRREKRGERRENSNEGNHAPQKTEVGPLLTTQWSQGKPYNNQCPVNAWGEHMVTGCVITAMAQVMNYYQWPKQGRGKHTNTGSFPDYVQTCDFSQSIYDWDNMIDNYETTDYTDIQADAVAQLMADLGCAIEAAYGGMYGTSANDENIPSVAAKYFHYKTLKPEGATWDEMLCAFLDQGHPILSSVTLLDGRGSHTVVCDGYRYRDGIYYYHVNMGWGGQDDGYYSFPSVAVFKNLESAIALYPSDAQTAEKDGVYFDIIDNEAVVMCSTDADPDGTCRIDIPASVEVNGMSYPVTRIDSLAFKHSLITRISFPGTIKKIPARLMGNHRTFEGGNLRFASFNEGLEEIGDEAFCDNKKMVGLTLPSTIKRIGDRAFRSTSISYVETESKAFSIGAENFHCHTFRGLENATEIGSYGVTGLNGTYTIQSNCIYYDCSVMADKVRIPASVDYELDTAVPYYGYEVDPGHPTLCCRDSILYNKDKTILLRFPSWYDLQFLRIPEGVVVVADGRGGTLTLPASLKEFHCSDFGSENKRVYCLGTTPPKIIGEVNPELSLYGRSRLMIPKGTRQAYEQADVWKEFNNICEVLYIDGPLIYNFGDNYGNPSDGYAQVIGRNMEYDFDGHITIPETVTIDGKDYTIGQVDGGAFLYDEAIKEVSLPATLYSLHSGGEALVTCPNIHTINVADGNEDLHVTDGMLIYKDWGENTLIYCPPMKKEGNAIVPRDHVTIPEEIKNIDFHAFSDNLYSVTIPGNVSYIKPTAFKRCANLMEIRCLGEYPPSYNSMYRAYGSIFNENVFQPEHGTILYVTQTAYDFIKNRYPEEWRSFPDIRVFDPASVTPVTIGKQPASRSYNLQGQRVDTGYRGIIISNGRKVLVK